MNNKFFTILVLVLAGIIAFQYFTKPIPADYTEYIKVGGKEYIKISSNVEIKWKDTIIYEPEYIPIPVPGKKEIVEVPADVDTTAILQDYFAKYFYSDIVPIDTIGTVQINDTISKNRIISRSLIFDYRVPTILETIIVKEKPKNQLYIGGGLGGSSIDIINSGYGSLLWKTKRDKIFVANFGAVNTELGIKSYYGAAMYWKIGK